MKKEEKKRKLYVKIVLAVAVILLVTDLILFWTSLQNEGVGCGFSRYWN